MIKHLMAAGVALAALATATQAAPVQWSSADGGNDHWYEVLYLGYNISWSDAQAHATGLTHNGEAGYLATITSAEEQSFLNGVNSAWVANSPNHSGQYVTAWLGGHRDSNGAFGWVTGEEFSDYENWNSGEPNNYRGEDELVGWWSGDKWNDCATHTCSVYKFVVEYGSSYDNNNNPPPVPLPAGLPMALAGFGLMGWIGSRRKSA